ncbi:CaCA family Na+/Ca+ antiporter [Oceaniovalibus guishaninsula JLT2003]|uniref:CaCA family Na+/Ca+ antiporter n=1 Tax=Oceaniovalibus guishaninsula JLT2003 TaxID=1231392 RepID=K2HN93_9RHOB|nr:calcium/sodium antiporter [Oceaniovalibus guishaninsula]EKE44329.1 CaCA family Na+/Ca+ antiporter [Oceaniovalibus guishaninsula JLT2003]
MSYLLVLAGFVLLIGGGEALVRGAVAVAARLGVSPMVIGLTLVGFGTSTPELLTSVQAALAGSPGVAVGNVVGSNIANILLIVGIAALLRPMAVAGPAFRRDGGAMLAVAVLAAALVLLGDVGRLSGGLLLAGLCSYLVFTIRSGAAPAEDLPAVPMRLVLALPLFAGGLLVTLLGARLLVTGAIDIAASLGVSEAVIGLSVVAIGTSLPELVTSVVAARRGQGDIALGNILGSNVFNILGILGATALIKPLEIPPQIALVDIWAMLAASVALLVMGLTGGRISRGEGGVLLACYAGYMGWLFAAA